MTPKITGAHDAPRLQLARRRHPQRDLEHEDFCFQAETLQALVCLLDGHVDKAGFIRWLRGASWPEQGINDLIEVLGSVFVADAEVHGPRIAQQPVAERWSW